MGTSVGSNSVHKFGVRAFWGVRSLVLVDEPGFEVWFFQIWACWFGPFLANIG